jgi:hypothetical protein
VVGLIDSTSFWVDLPDGWQADQAAAKRLGAIFILLPADSTFGSAPFLVIASVFHSTSVAVAMAKDTAAFRARDPDLMVSDKAQIAAAAGQQLSLREFRSARLRSQAYETVAYVALGPNVLALTYSAETEPQYQAGLPVFQGLLKTYGAGPKVVPAQ